MGQWYNENQIAAARGKDAAQQKAGDTSMSGRGSTAESTVGVRAVLPRLVELFNIVSIADVPCGDFNYMREILSSQAMRSRPLKYVGGDIVSKLVTRLNTLHGDGERVSFMRFDLYRQTLWPVDLIIVRDLLFHFSRSRVLGVLRRINDSGARYLLTTTKPSARNKDTCEMIYNASDPHAHERPLPSGCKAKFVAGLGFRGANVAWPINLQDAPFNLPPPILSFGLDGYPRWDHMRVMALWRLPLKIG